jgi:hypothetical protein
LEILSLEQESLYHKAFGGASIFCTLPLFYFEGLGALAAFGRQRLTTTGNVPSLVHKKEAT